MKQWLKRSARRAAVAAVLALSLALTGRTAPAQANSGQQWNFVVGSKAFDLTLVDGHGRLRGASPYFDANACLVVNPTAWKDPAVVDFDVSFSGKTVSFSNFAVEPASSCTGITIISASGGGTADSTWPNASKADGSLTIVFQLPRGAGGGRATATSHWEAANLSGGGLFGIGLPIPEEWGWLLIPLAGGAFAILTLIRGSAKPLTAPAAPVTRPGPPVAPGRVARQVYWPHRTPPVPHPLGNLPPQHPPAYSPGSTGLVTLGVLNPPGVQFTPPPIGPDGPLQLPKVGNLVVVLGTGTVTLTWFAPVIPPGLLLVGYAVLVKPSVNVIGGVDPSQPMVQWPPLGPGSPGVQTALAVPLPADTLFYDLRPLFKDAASGQIVMDPW